jgi:diguanylate cyclase (GGDEF)-like protein
MINVRVQELEAIADTLNRELQVHESWRDQIQRTLVCRLTPSPADLAEDAHCRCEFGKWFYSSQNAALRGLPIFKNIENLHKGMHDEARALCTIIKNNWVITPNEYDPFLRAMQQFRDELHLIRGRVFETLRKIDALTGVFCGSELVPDLEAIVRQQEEHGKPCSLLRLQFDMQEINQHYGREAGDHVLSTCLGRIKAALADQDRIYRYTGADFVICLPGKSTGHVEQIKDILFHTIHEAVEHALLIHTAASDKAQESAGDEPPSAETGQEAIGEKAAPDEKNGGPILTVNYAIQPLKSGVNIEELLKQAGFTAHDIQLS